MKKILFISLMIPALSACTATGPAEDEWDREENRPKISIAEKIFNNKGSENSKENAELRARLEKLEKQQGSSATATPTYSNPPRSNDITAPPVYKNQQPTTPAVDPSWQNSASYAEWKRARQNNSGDYKEFKEYKEWLEFQKLKKK